MNKDLIKYIKDNIFPKYERFYAHGMIHVINVIKTCLLIGKSYNLNENILYTMAVYHDLGLSVDRENHEYESGKIVENDRELRNFFTEEEIKIIKEAVEDPRGSKRERPRSIYGEILSDADRDFDIRLLAKRQLATSIKNYPELKKGEEHFLRCYEYIMKRLNKEGHFNLWTEHPLLIRQRSQFEKDYFDKEYAKKVYLEEYTRIKENGTYEKIKNYYLDY